MERFEAKNIILVGEVPTSTPFSTSIIEIGPFCLAMDFIGTTTGTLYLNCSNNGLSFYEYGHQLVNGPLIRSYNVPDAYWKFIQLVWAPISGSGTCTLSLRTYNH